MKALLIKPSEKSIEIINVQSTDEISELIGYDTVISDELSGSGDKLFFDEECFLRGAAGRFQLDKLIPVSGIGVIIGTAENGDLADCTSDIDDIRSRTVFQD